MDNTKIGIDKYLEPDNGLPDLFVSREGYYHFPCSDCINTIQPSEYCKKCKHWVA